MKVFSAGGVQQILVGQDDLAHLVGCQVAGGPTFIEECDIQGTGAAITNQIIDCGTEKIAECIFR
jgi:hypothetical protein